MLFGGLLAYLTNTDKLHEKLREVGFSSRTSHPSEWFGVLSEKVMYVVLQMKDSRRLYGWPKEWPTNADHGSFYIMEPSWIDESGNAMDLTTLDGLLINVEDVKWVEFLHSHPFSSSHKNIHPPQEHA